MRRLSPIVSFGVSSVRLSVFPMRIAGNSDWLGGPGGQRPTGRALRAPSAPTAAAPDGSLPAPGTAAEVLPGPGTPAEALPAPAPAPPPGDKAAHDDPNLFTRRKPDRAPGAPPSGTSQLTPEQQAEVAELRHRDAEVRAHEAAHAAAAGALGGGASYDYATGPDGRSYAVGGEVPVEMAPGRTPEETIRNAAQLRAAALAPAQPSAQDRAVAAEASAMEAAARAEIAARSASSHQPERASPPLHSLGTPAETTPPRESEAAVEHAEPAQVIQQLEVEQRTSRAGWRHLHSGDGCGAYSQAVAAYR